MAFFFIFLLYSFLLVCFLYLSISRCRLSYIHIYTYIEEHLIAIEQFTFSPFLRARSSLDAHEHGSRRNQFAAKSHLRRRTQRSARQLRVSPPTFI